MSNALRLVGLSTLRCSRPSRRARDPRALSSRAGASRLLGLATFARGLSRRACATTSIGVERERRPGLDVDGVGGNEELFFMVTRRALGGAAFGVRGRPRRAELRGRFDVACLAMTSPSSDECTDGAPLIVC